MNTKRVQPLVAQVQVSWGEAAQDEAVVVEYAPAEAVQQVLEVAREPVQAADLAQDEYEALVPVEAVAEMAVVE